MTDHIGGIAGLRAGVAHDAAWQTEKEPPAEGWRNTYDWRSPLGPAHLAAHSAMMDFERAEKQEGESFEAYKAAMGALINCPNEGRYEDYVPRPSEITELGTSEGT